MSCLFRGERGLLLLLGGVSNVLLRRLHWQSVREKISFYQILPSNRTKKMMTTSMCFFIASKDVHAKPVILCSCFCVQWISFCFRLFSLIREERWEHPTEFPAEGLLHLFRRPKVCLWVSKNPYEISRLSRFLEIANLARWIWHILRSSLLCRSNIYSLIEGLEILAAVFLSCRTLEGGGRCGPGNLKLIN